MPDDQRVQFTELSDLRPLPGTETPPDPRALQAELDALREQARQEGFAQGMQTAQEQAQPALEALAHAAQARRDEVDRISRRLEREALELATALAELLVDDHITHEPKALLPIVERALSFVTDAESVQVLVSPADLDVVQGALARLEPHVAGDLRLRADDNIMRGGCRVVSELGDMDATRQTRSQQLRQRMDELRGERGAH